MAYLNLEVKIPEERVTFKKSNKAGVRYVYKVIAKKRNSKGTPTSIEVSIGKEIEGKPGFMIPNQNYEKYYELPENTNFSLPTKTLNNGATTFLTMLSNDLGLVECLNNVFHERTQYFLQIAIYMLLKGNVISNMEFFLDESYLDSRLDDRRISELFSNISREDEIKFFELWTNKIMLESRSIAYDITSISTYSNNKYAEYGYNRDKDNLPQINLGMLYGLENKLPLAYSMYSGSIPDKTYFAYALELSKKLNITNEVYVMDRGFYTIENLKLCNESEIDFIMAVSKSNRIFKESIRKNNKDIEKIKNHINGTNLFGVKDTVEINGRNYYLHIFKSSFGKSKEQESIFRMVDSLEKELENNMKPHKKKRYTDFYDIEYSDEGVIKSYSKNSGKIDEILENAGVFCILTNKAEYTTSDVINTYKLRDRIEKSYNDLKNEIDCKRFLTHNSNTTNGKFFIKFISLILWSYIKDKKKDYKANITVEQLLLTFEKIRTYKFKDDTALNEPLTKKQKDLLDLFGIDKEEFIKNLKNI